MKPSFLNYFFAHAAAVAAFGGAAFLSFVVLWETAPALLGGVAPLPSLLAIIISIPLGMILGYLLFGYPLFFIGRIVNGGPFREGDSVRILVGPYKDRVVRIYEVWSERNQIRVDLGKPSEAAYSDVFSVLQVCREH